MDFLSLKKNLKKDYAAYPCVKIAILGDSPTQFLHQMLKGYGYEIALNYEIFEADYNQIERQISNISSELYQIQPDLVIIFASTQKLWEQFTSPSFSEKKGFADAMIHKIQSWVAILNQQLNTQVIVANFPEINEGIFGNFANKMQASFTYQVRKINFELMNLAIAYKNVFVLDISALQNRYGQNQILHIPTYIQTEIIYAPDFWAILAKQISDIVLSIRGVFKKCLILDLDNTLWGGIIGDDGIEHIQLGNLGIGKAFSDLQLWAKQLKERGIILAVCSKNEESIAKEPFEKHQDMILHLSDIAVFVANWENKVDNIHYIQSVLNIGFDAMVFLDDNPFERNMVREAIPAICVPELPEDPALYVPFLTELNLFEIANISEEDAQRTQQYQVQAQRMALQQSFENEGAFLQSLDMTSKVSAFDTFQIPRIAQLTQRSNQFNLRTIRYSEKEIGGLINNPHFITFSFTLADKWGELGLISLIILEKRGADCLFIDTWLMSCRVLKRGMEQFVLNQMVEKAKAIGVNKMIGEYLPTAKNGIVKDHYDLLGFQKDGNNWTLNIWDYQAFDVYIQAIYP